MIHLRAAVFVALVLVASTAAPVHGAGPYPEAISWSPMGTDVPLDTVIVIEWSMRMDPGSVRSAFVFTETDGDAVWRSDSFAWFDSPVAPYQSVATPLFPLRSATSYTVLVWPTATDAGGDFALDQDGDGVGGEVPDDLLAWTFVTEDRESPQVLDAVPTPGSEGVAVTSVLELQFSERMDTASVESALSVSPPVPRILTWEADGAVLRLDPPLAFAYGTSYTVRVKGAAARDLAGNALDGDGDGRGGDDYVASFVTEVDVNPPRVWATTPGAASTNVAVSANVEIRFSETMNRSSVAWAFSYTDGTSKWTQDNGTLAWKSLNFADDAVVFNPYDNFAFARTFTVRLNASRAQDAAGFFLDGDRDGVSEGSPADDYAWAFTIETTDTRSPTVLAVDPPKGSLGAAETTATALTFSEAMNRTSVEDGFSLASGMRTWTKTDGTFAWTRGNDVVAYTPATSLGFDTEYALVLDGAIVRDVNGNRLDGDGDGVGGDSFFASFRTRPEPDRTPPIVVSTLPPEGAEDVSRTPTFVLTFDDAMDRAATEASIGLENVTANGTTPIPTGHFQWTAANHTIAFRALVPLEWDALHRLTVSQGAKDDAGFFLEKPFAITFRTAKWSGRVVGRVVDDTNPVAGATVTLGNLTTQTVTTQTAPNGTFLFPTVTAGEYNLTVERAGYVTVRTVVLLDPRDVDPKKAAIDLGTISLQSVEDVRPLLVAGAAIALSAALVLAGLLRRRRDRFREHFEELEPEEGEAEH